MPMKKYCAAFVLFVNLLIQIPSAHAVGEEKNLKGRLGVGFTSQIATTTLGNIPALSAKYYPSRSFATSAAVGFDTRSNDSAFAVGLKAYRNVFTESNLIFYLGGGLAYVNNKGNKLQPSIFLGSEFFLPQIPSLGFSFEAGVRGDSSSGSFAIRTTGDSFLTAGTHFYF
ncbi:MAG: hypothetical protein EOP11_11635 [Proteobacteria bacterium]|nr:MAG: hypothetical protein EOP11_11635 [Pseudomonadota bacterium]